MALLIMNLLFSVLQPYNLYGYEIRKTDRINIPAEVRETNLKRRPAFFSIRKDIMGKESIIIIPNAAKMGKLP